MQVLKNSVLPILLIIVAFLLSGCGGGGGGGGSSTGAISCGTGTHNNGSNVCIKDTALYTINATNTYWLCGNGSSKLLINSDGTGSYLPPPQGNGITPVKQAITWNEVPTDEIDLTYTTGGSLSPFLYLSMIGFNGNYTYFSANGGGGSNFVCNLTSGTF